MKATNESVEPDDRESSPEARPNRSAEPASSGISAESDEPRPPSGGAAGSTDVSSGMDSAARSALSVYDWSMSHPGVSQNQMMPSMPFPPTASFASRGFGPGFVPASLAGSDAAVAAGQMDTTALLNAQQSMQHEREAPESQGAGGPQRASGGSSSHSSSPPPEEAPRDSSELLTQQRPQQQLLQQQQPLQQIDPRLLASMPLANPFLGAALPGAPPMNDYQSALLRAASAPFLPGIDINTAASNLAAGQLPNMLGLGQYPFFGVAGLPTSQGFATSTQAPDSSRYASLRGGSVGQRSDISIPSQERGIRPLGTHPALTGVARGILEPFPERLHRLLTEVEAAGHSDIVSFTEDGQSFKIHKPEEFFRRIVQVYFKQTRLSSFKRQLNLYGFELIDHGKNKGGYYHELFMRDQPDLARQIRRVDNKFSMSDKKKKKHHGRYSRSQAPDFYSMPPVLSHEEAEKKLAASRSSGEEVSRMETGSDKSSESSDYDKSGSGSNKKRKSSDDDDQDRKRAPSEST